MAFAPLPRADTCPRPGHNTTILKPVIFTILYGGMIAGGTYYMRDRQPNPRLRKYMLVCPPIPPRFDPTLWSPNCPPSCVCVCVCI